MTVITIAAQRAIPASAEAVYALLADYHHGHSSILPPAFSDLTVLSGGTGEGAFSACGAQRLTASQTAHVREKKCR